MVEENHVDRLTKLFGRAIVDRAKTDLEFREDLINEVVNLFDEGKDALAKSILKDYVLGPKDKELSK